jgi:pimeloyl-ACP methyl ester carboxylesterase
MTGPTSLSVTANGLEHRVLEWSAPLGTRSRGPARTVVLVHGYMDAAGTWDRVAPVLASSLGARVLAPDMRGFGEGARVARGGYYHFVDYVFDLAELVDALSPSAPLALVGHSMGGTIATLYTGTFPERVVRLANLEGLGPPDNSWEAGPTRMRHWIEGVRSLRARGERRTAFTRAEALARLAASHPTIPDEVLADRLPHLVREVGDGRVAWRFDPLHRTTAPVPFFAKLLGEFARRITCPVVFVSGGPDGFHLQDEDERLASYERLTRSEIRDAGHMMHWTRPEAVGETLVRFFVG